ncbi:four helix bundle protein [Telmatobacter bradus]|uniref:four helix bundle protein n=1 Tax=Telmatobacter bradus TaxID=474953 RepID=UPI003B43305F
MSQDFQNLTVWQRAMELAEAVYELTRQFPPEELYGLTSQLRRASISVASNIAEGRGRGSDGDFRRFLAIALGSNYEVQTQLLLARRLKIGDAQQTQKTEELCVETSKMLAAFL